MKIIYEINDKVWGLIHYRIKNNYYCYKAKGTIIKIHGCGLIEINFKRYDGKNHIELMNNFHLIPYEEKKENLIQKLLKENKTLNNQINKILKILE